VATTPLYASVLRGDLVQVSSTANANRDGTGTITTLCAGVAAGTRIDRIDFAASGDLADGCISIFVSSDTGTTWRYIGGVDYGNPAAGSATVLPWAAPWVAPRGGVHLPGTAFLIGAANTAAPTAGVLNAQVNGVNFT